MYIKSLFIPTEEMSIEKQIRNSCTCNSYLSVVHPYSNTYAHGELKFCLATAWHRRSIEQSWLCFLYRQVEGLEGKVRNRNRRGHHPTAHRPAFLNNDWCWLESLVGNGNRELGILLPGNWERSADWKGDGYGPCTLGRVPHSLAMFEQTIESHRRS